MDTVHRFPGTGEYSHMLPIGDDNSDRRLVPYVTYALIVFNILFSSWS